LDDGPTKKRKQNKTITQPYEAKFLRRRRTFGKKGKKINHLALPHLLKPTNKFLFFYSHFDDVARKY